MTAREGKAVAQFETGNPGGPGGTRSGAGRKSGLRTEVATRLFGNVPETDLAAIIEKAVVQATEGDVQARAWLFDRIFGRTVPTDLAEVQQQVREEFETFREAVLDAMAEAGDEQKQRVLLRISAGAASRTLGG